MFEVFGIFVVLLVFGMLSGVSVVMSGLFGVMILMMGVIVNFLYNFGFEVWEWWCVEMMCIVGWCVVYVIGF